MKILIFSAGVQPPVLFKQSLDWKRHILGRMLLLNIRSTKKAHVHTVIIQKISLTISPLEGMYCRYIRLYNIYLHPYACINEIFKKLIT
jgi:hypothetical protein